MRRLLLDVVGGIAHRDGQAAHLEHRQIVLHVADGGDRVGRDAQTLRHRLDKGALVLAGRRDVEIIALRPDRGGLRAQRLLHRDLRSARSSAGSALAPTILQAVAR